MGFGMRLLCLPLLIGVLIAGSSDLSGQTVAKRLLPPPGGGCVDGDSDGYGSPGDRSCPNGPETDCNDADGTINPGAVDDCDGIDNDCDGLKDEDDPEEGATCRTGLPGICDNGFLTCALGDLVCEPA